MGSSSIAVQQREKEAKSLRTLLTFGLLGSLALHAGVLASGIGNILSRKPDLADKPLEVVMVEPPKVKEVEKPQPKPQPQQVQQPRIREPQQQVVRQTPPPPRVQPVPRTAPPPKVETKQPIESVKPAPAPAAKPEPAPVAKSEPAPAAPNPALRSTLGAARESQANVLTGVGNSTAPTVAPGNGATPGSQTPVAAGLRTVRQGTPQRQEGNSEGSGRLSCKNCSKPKYPERARKRGVEGTAKVAVDVDSKGRVTNVRVTESSGDEELDRAAARAAQKWKFDAPKGGRQGVVAKVDFALEGSKRHREVKERQRQRAERRKKKRQAEAASQNKPPVANNSAAPSSSSQAAPDNDRSKLRESLRQLR